MKNFWKIFRHEYVRHVLRKRFLLVLASVPLWIFFSIGMGLLSAVLATNHTPVGVVDQAKILDETTLNVSDDDSFLSSHVAFLSYTDTDQAETALNAKKIQGYFLIPADYRESLHVQLYYHEQPSSSIISQMQNTLRHAWLKGQSAAVISRVMSDPDLEIHETGKGDENDSGNWLKIAAPLALAVFLIVSVFSSAGYLMQAVIEEKENRTMEILATSASPEAIMGGKITALICVGLIQVILWSLLPLAAIAFVSAYTPLLDGLSLDYGAIALGLLTAIPTFILVASLMAAIGATVTEANEGQQVSSLITLPVMIPLMLMGVFIAQPNGAIALFFSFFPLTAALSILIRMAFTSVPVWQILLSTGLLLASAVGALWLAGRVFRLGMLRYGQRMSLQEVWQGLGAARPHRQERSA